MLFSQHLNSRLETRLTHFAAPDGKDCGQLHQIIAAAALANGRRSEHLSVPAPSPRLLRDRWRSRGSGASTISSLPYPVSVCHHARQGTDSRSHVRSGPNAAGEDDDGGRGTVQRNQLSAAGARRCRPRHIQGRCQWHEQCPAVVPRGCHPIWQAVSGGVGQGCCHLGFRPTNHCFEDEFRWLVEVTNRTVDDCFCFFLFRATLSRPGQVLHS